VTEAKLVCTTKMINSLDPRSPAGVRAGRNSRAVERGGREVLGFTPDAFRKRLSRAPPEWSVHEEALRAGRPEPAVSLREAGGLRSQKVGQLTRATAQFATHRNAAVTSRRRSRR